MLVVGAGINGAVAAASLAARGVKVALVERSDFASGSSSQSSNLAWGGIKYLESGEFLLVNKLCRSRNHLMRHYPSSVKEIRFLTTIRRGFRMPPFFIYLGALLYWFIGACFTKSPRYLRKKDIVRRVSAINADSIIGGLEYSDCYLPDNDSRFVFRFVRKAMEAGCCAVNYAEVKSAQLGTVEQGESCWLATVADRLTGETTQIRSRVLINACGPYVDHFNQLIQHDTNYQHVFSKGIHLIVDRVIPREVMPEDKVLAFFASDGRLFFVLPMGPKTCIGTTDTRVDSPTSTVSEEDRQFVLDNANEMLNLPRKLTTKDIIAERCGVRPLAVKKARESGDDWLTLSRKHVTEVDASKRLLSIFGGKLTDCINVGEEVAQIVSGFGVGAAQNPMVWYGEPPASDKKAFLARTAELDIDGKVKTLSGEPLSERIWRRYGAFANELLDAMIEDDTLLEKPIQEIEYTRGEIMLMAKTEMIITLEDFLRRRSKVLMVMSAEELIKHPGLRDIAKLLFNGSAESKLQDFIERHTQ
ncbi:glycerol-3-phosphate dehydrogenase/oxidase [Aurantivibrio plasticivorans]